MNTVKILSLLILQSSLSVELFAQNAAGAAQPEISVLGQLMQMIPMFVMVFLVFFFFVIKPQNKKLDEHREMITALKGGTKVMIASGIHAKVVKVHDHEVDVEIAPNVKVKVNKDYISKAL